MERLQFLHLSNESMNLITWIKNLFSKNVEIPIGKRSPELYDKVAQGICAACFHKTLVKGARGGMALNSDCFYCGAKYWWTPGFREIGAERLK